MTHNLTSNNLQSDTQGAEMLLLEDYIFSSTIMVTCVLHLYCQDGAGVVAPIVIDYRHVWMHWRLNPKHRQLITYGPPQDNKHKTLTYSARVADYKHGQLTLNALDRLKVDIDN